jgi:hypothetical protein
MSGEFWTFVMALAGMLLGIIANIRLDELKKK